MTERRELHTYPDLSRWYDLKYTQMQGTWVTPPEDCNRHLDALGVVKDPLKWLLDIGCGGGHFMEQAAKRVDCVGLEISKVAAQYARQRLAGAPNTAAVVEEALEDFSTGIRFDYITSIGSLEHVLNLDAALDKVRELLQVGGKWYFYLPNTKWVHLDQPNELLADEEWWTKKLAAHGLIMEHTELWGIDNVAYWGRI